MHSFNFLVQDLMIGYTRDFHREIFPFNSCSSGKSQYINVMSAIIVSLFPLVWTAKVINSTLELPWQSSGTLGQHQRHQLSLNCQCVHMKWSHGFILGTEVGQRPQMLIICNLNFRQLSLNCHMKCSHGFILGTEVGQRPQMLIIRNLNFRQLSLNCQCGHMKWSHGFILGTEVARVETLDAISILGSSL